MKKRCAAIGCCSLAVFALVQGLSSARSREEKESIASRVLWEKEFSGAIVRVELLQKNGLLHIVAREGMKKPAGVKKEDWPKRRYLLSPDGNVLWEGDARASGLLADHPFAIMLKTDNQRLSLEAVDPQRGRGWQLELPEGLPVSTVANPESSLLVLALLPYEWMSGMDRPYPAKIVAVDMERGRIAWTSELENLQGEIDEFGGDLSVAQGAIWWAGGRRAFAADAKNGRVYWQAPIAEGFKSARHWAFGNGQAFVSNGGTVWGLSADKGVLWKKTLPDKTEVHALAYGAEGLACSSLDKKQMHVQLLDPWTGGERWRRSFKHKKKKLGVPRGLAFSDGRLVAAVGGKIVAVKISGEMEYERAVKSRIFSRWERLVAHRDRIVLTGAEGAYAYSTATGERLWEQAKFIDPVYEQRKIRQAAVQLGLSSFYMHQAPEAAKAWKEYQSGSRSYSDAAITAAAQQSSYNMAQDAKLRESSAQLSQGIGRFVEIELELANRALGDQYASFYRHRGSRIGALKTPNDLDAAVVELDSGRVTEVGLQKTRAACVPQFLVDPGNRRIYQAFRQMALLCNDENRLVAYKY